ncbi:hypothetical protein AG1IA_07321 [Rhizoctonia solani AG-1 IA]|uniref:Uncharacterized protein n=1 Tax=Thanatephorus cucumeris (strain AG1-IA) TaxID=983506 RepID=L8WPE3_THACA|nr:hypothetical protein AG1IA_07321 [Rhizoctonia solani AG-1 IA]
MRPRAAGLARPIRLFACAPISLHHLLHARPTDNSLAPTKTRVFAREWTGPRHNRRSRRMA